MVLKMRNENENTEQIYVKFENSEEIKTKEIDLIKNLKIESTPKENSNNFNNFNVASNNNSENKIDSGGKNQITNRYNSNNSDISSNLKENSLLNFDNTKLSEKGYNNIGDRSTSKNTQTNIQKSITNSQIKNLHEMSFRNNMKNSNVKSSSESNRSEVSNVSNVSNISNVSNQLFSVSKKSSHSFYDSGSAECETLLPLNNRNLKNEILKEITKNVNLNSELLYSKTLDYKSMTRLLNNVIYKLKEFKLKSLKGNIESDCYDVVITKEFLINHKGEYEEIIKNSFLEIKKKTKFKKNVVKQMINNLKAIEQIENRKFKFFDDKIKRQKAEYLKNQKNSIKQIQFVNNL